MAEFPANPTDTAICGLLAGAPAPTVAIAARLGVPERTVRHRLYRLRQAGAVVSGSDGLYRLAAPVPAAPIAGPLPALAAPVVDLAAPVPPALAAGPLPALAAGPLPALAAAALGLAVAGWIVVTVRMRRMPPPPPPARPTGFGNAVDPWAWMPGPTW